MTASKLNLFWTVTIVLLIVITVIGGILVWSSCSPGQRIDISLPQSQEPPGKIYIDGAVTNPGLYPLTTSDTIEALIQAAGGTTGNADLSELKLYVAEIGQEREPQRININRAEAWLLEALPGIGPTLAQRMVDYREQNGPFLNINELTEVEGIGTTKYEQIKHLITVADQ